MVLKGEEALECEVYVNWMSRNLIILDVFWTNRVQMGQSVVERWRVGGGLQVPLGP